MRLSEELGGLGADHDVLLRERRDTHREHARVRDARLLLHDALLPHPRVSLDLALLADAEREVALLFLSARQRERETTNVGLGSHAHKLSDRHDARHRSMPCCPPLPRASYPRSERIGSTRVARTAGASAAIAVTSVMSAVSVSSVSHGTQSRPSIVPRSLLVHAHRERDTERDPRGESRRRLTEHERHDRPAASAKRHADAHLASPELDRIREQPVQAERRQHETEHGEHPRDDRTEPILRHALVLQRLHRRQAINRERGIDLRDHAAQ